MPALTLSVHKFLNIEQMPQKLETFLKCIGEQFASTRNCSLDLIFPWREDFDSLVFQTLYFFSTFCEKVYRHYF